jgi:hypothetical protein
MEAPVYLNTGHKRNRQFQHFIKPRLFKISTLTMHGFVEKLWKFYHCNPWCKQREVRHVTSQERNYFDANLPQRGIGRATGDMSLTCWPPRSPDLTPGDFFYSDMSKTTSSSLPFLLLRWSETTYRNSYCWSWWRYVNACLCKNSTAALMCTHRTSVSCNKIPKFLYKTVHRECRYLK